MSVIARPFARQLLSSGSSCATRNVLTEIVSSTHLPLCYRASLQSTTLRSFSAQCVSRSPRSSPEITKAQDSQASKVDSGAKRSSDEVEQSKPFEATGQEKDEPQFRFISLKTILVTSGIFGLAFAGSAVWSREENRALKERLLTQSKASVSGSLDSIFAQVSKMMGGGQSEELMALRKAWAYDTASRLGEYYKSLMRSLKGMPEDFQTLVSRVYLSSVDWYVNLPSHKLAMVPVMAIDTVVFLAWRVPSLNKFMMTHFLDVAGSGKVYTMITSAFSHQSLAHFALNSIALWSFGSLALDVNHNPTKGSLGEKAPEIDTRPRLLGFFVCGALMSGFASRFNKNVNYALFRRIYNKALKGNNPTKYTLSELGKMSRLYVKSGSLGSSGVAYGIVVLTALNLPHINIGIIFIPGLSCDIQTGVLCMVLLDTIGLLWGWRLFDHAAHLGGALFGYLWYSYGADSWQWIRDHLGASRQAVEEKPHQQEKPLSPPMQRI
ncbi:unnamed protein product [Sympodiomycopsis kandeliae]